MTLSSILLDKDITSDILRNFYQFGIQEITLPLPLHPTDENNRSFLRILKGVAKPSPEFLVFVPIEKAGKKRI